MKQLFTILVIVLVVGCSATGEDAQETPFSCDCPQNGTISATEEDLFGNWRLIRRTVLDSLDNVIRIDEVAQNTACVTDTIKIYPGMQADNEDIGYINVNLYPNIAKSGVLTNPVGAYINNSHIPCHVVKVNYSLYYNTGDNCFRLLSARCSDEITATGFFMCFIHEFTPTTLKWKQKWGTSHNQFYIMELEKM